MAEASAGESLPLRHDFPYPEFRGFEREPLSLKPVSREDCPYGEVSELAEGTRLEIA